MNSQLLSGASPERVKTMAKVMVGLTFLLWILGSTSPKYSDSWWRLPGNCISPGCMEWETHTPGSGGRWTKEYGPCAKDMEVTLHRHVPRILHQLWFDDLESRPKTLMKSCRRVNSGWQVRVWQRSDLTWLKNQALFDAASDAQAKEIARWELLAKFGGVVSDVEVECVKSFEPLARRLEDFTSTTECFAAYQDQEAGLVGVSAVGCILDSEAAQILVEGAAQRDLKDAPWRAFGAGYLTDALDHPLYAYKMEFMLLPEGTFNAGPGEIGSEAHSKMNVTRVFTWATPKGASTKEVKAQLEETKAVVKSHVASCHNYKDVHKRFASRDQGQWYLVVDALEGIFEVASRHGEPIFLTGETLYGAMRMFNRQLWDEDLFLAFPKAIFTEIMSHVNQGTPLESGFAKDLAALWDIDFEADAQLRLRVIGVQLALRAVPYQVDGQFVTGLKTFAVSTKWSAAYEAVFPTKMWAFDRLAVPIPNMPEMVLAAQDLSLYGEPILTKRRYKFTEPVGKIRITVPADPTSTVELLPELLRRAREKLEDHGYRLADDDGEWCSIQRQGSAAGRVAKLESWVQTACEVWNKRVISMDVDVVELASGEPGECQILALINPYAKGKKSNWRVDVFCAYPGAYTRVIPSGIVEWDYMEQDEIAVQE